jgi:hypothetical protein
MKKQMSRSELEDLHSVLRRAAERAERNNENRLAEKLTEEVMVLAQELARAG